MFPSLRFFFDKHMREGTAARAQIFTSMCVRSVPDKKFCFIFFLLIFKENVFFDNFKCALNNKMLPLRACVVTETRPPIIPSYIMLYLGTLLRFIYTDIVRVWKKGIAEIFKGIFTTADLILNSLFENIFYFAPCLPAAGIWLLRTEMLWILIIY